MNILLINHDAGSEEMGKEYRPYYFAREWVKQGHKVFILTADFSNIRKKNPAIFKDFQKEVIDGINYYWIRTIRYKGKSKKRQAAMTQFISKLYKSAERIVDVMEPDVIITSSTYPLDTYVGEKIKNLSDKPVKLIHEVNSMWAVNPLETGRLSTKYPLVKAMQHREDYFCNRCDMVVSPIPCTEEYVRKHGLEYEKFAFIPNGVVLEDWENPEPLPDRHEKVLNKLKYENKFVICAFGLYNKPYMIQYLIDAAKVINDPRLHVVFIGDSLYKKKLIEETEGFEDTFTFLPTVPKECLSSVYDKIDASYIGARINGMGRFNICKNTIFEIMMGGKPVLYAVNAPHNYVAEYQCGVSVEAEDLNELINGIENLMATDEEETVKMGDNGKKAAQEYFNYSVQSKRFLETIEENE